MDLKQFLQSKAFTRTLYGIGVFIVALLIFQAGLFVGYNKAGFSFRFGQDYYRAFGEQREGFPPGMQNLDFLNANGAIGKIASINLPTFVVEDQSGIEKVVITSSDTVVRQFRNTLSLSNLKSGDFVVIFGSPNNKDQIEAKLIRLVPPPPSYGPGSSATSSRPSNI